MTPAHWRRITVGLLIGLAVALGLYDLAAYVMGGNDSTLSIVIRDAGRDNPIIVFLMGLAVGHWIWPQAPRNAAPTVFTPPGTVVIAVPDTEPTGPIDHLA